VKNVKHVRTTVITSTVTVENGKLLASTTTRGTEVTTETVTVDGIPYKVHRDRDGSTVDSPCACFGSTYRAHSTFACPWLAKRSCP